MKLDVVVLPVADVERAKDLYGQLGGAADPDWPDWYAAFMVAERAGTELPI